MNSDEPMTVVWPEDAEWTYAVASIPATPEMIASVRERCVEAMKEQIRYLQMEVAILRQYGNKDCTAMADERLAKALSGEEPWE